MLWDVDTDLDKLTAAPEARDKSATRAFCDDLIARIYKTAEPYPLKSGEEAAFGIEEKAIFRADGTFGRRFHSDRLWLGYGPQAYVQALLDQGHFTAALLVLERLITDTESTDPTENAEAKGLMGRHTSSCM
jgi:hypothetical protein